MLAAAIEKVRELVTAGKRITFETTEGFRDTTIVVFPDGTVEYKDNSPRRRDARLSGITDLVQYVQDSSICKSPEIYVGGQSIVVYLDRTTRFDAAILSLTRSDRYQALIDLLQGAAFTTKEAIAFLRFRLDTPNTSSVTAALRRIDFKRTSDGVSVVEHGKETFGRNVELSVAQADTFPEEFTVNCLVFSNPDFAEQATSTFRVGILVDLENERVMFRTYKDEMTEKHEAALRAIADKLNVDLPDVPVFCGTTTAP